MLVLPRHTIPTLRRLTHSLVDPYKNSLMSPTYPNPTACPSKAPTDRIESIHTVYFGHEDAREEIYLHRLEREVFGPERAHLAKTIVLLLSI